MPELITATLAISSPNPGSANAAAGKPAISSASKPAEGGSKDGAPPAKEADSPFGAVLQKQMAKSGNESQTQPDTAAQNVAAASPESLSADSTAAIFAALTGEFALALPKGLQKQVSTSDTTATTDTSNLLSPLPEATAVPLTVPVAAQLLPQTERAASEPVAARPLTAGIKEAPLPGDGKIALDAAITAETAHRDIDHGDTSFQVLLDSRAHQAQAPATAASSQASSAPVLRIDTPVGQAGWHEEMGQKLTWIATSTRQQADLVLTPPNLGRVEISLSINGDQANAVFASPNASVRDLIETSLPRLREILAESGINLGQTHVGSESASQSSNNPNGGGFRGDRADDRYPGSAATNGDVAVLGGSGLIRTMAGRGMVDIFA